MFDSARNSLLLGMSLLAGLACAQAAWAQGPTPGQNVNMVSGTRWPGGDPFLQRQNEPSIAVSTRNPQHLLAGANDYRTVDLPISDVLPAEEAGDAWLGIFKSFDGGASWQSTLIPGFPQDTSAAGMASPMKGFTAASDPVVRAGSNGMFYYSGIAFNRGANIGGLFLTRFIDLNNKENGDATRYPDLPTDPIRYIGTVKIDSGNAGQFIDKPWLAVDIPRSNAVCTISVPEPGAPGGSVSQTIPAGNVYMAYAMFVGGQINIRSKINFTKSSDCGATWTKPVMISQTYDINQGTAVAVDPVTGYVYVAWRTFSAGNDVNSIVVTKSIDGGNTFGKAVPVQALASFTSTTPNANAFFDQGTSGTTFRTNAYPAIGVDANSQVYMAWSQRGVGPNGDARIMLSTSPDGINWSAPSPVDIKGTFTDDLNQTFTRGHQFMPSIAILGGQVMVAYYDLRLDHTVGFFTASNPPLEPDPNNEGKLYKEARTPEGELLLNPSAVFTAFVDDLGLTQRRHTVDLMVTQAVPSSQPAFIQPVRVSQYIFGLRGDLLNPSQLQQLQENPPNLPLFAMGSEPFLGDYIDITGQTMVPMPTAPGGWVFNTAANPSLAPVFFTAWTTNQDVRPPHDGNWKNYTPVGTGGQSVFDPTQTRPNCMPGQEGMRNQNIYSSQVTQGLLVSSPQTLKPLSSTLQRAFVVLVQNLTNFDKTFHMTIANQPPGGFASFIAGTNNPGPPPSVTPPSPATTALDVDIPPHSGITRPVFATSNSVGASITVNVVETTPPPGINSGLASFVVFNGDPTSPLQLINPDGVTGEDIATVEIYSPSTSDPALYNPNAPNPNAPNPNPNTGLSNPNAPNPNAPNPNAPNPNAPNPNAPNPNAPNPNAPNPNAPNPNAPNPNAPNSVIANPNAPNPNAPNPNAPNPNAPNTNITNTSIFDAIYTVTNTGDTAASYHVKLVGNNPGNIPLQLAVNKTYQTPTSSSYYQTPTGSAPTCQLTTENHNNVQALINNPPILSPTNLSDPDIQDPSSGNTTFALFPGESALIVLRGYFASYSDPSAAFAAFKTLITQTIPVVASHAANTNTNTIVVSSPLLITTTNASFTQGVVGQTYALTQLTAVGGNPSSTLTWAVVPGSGALPPGLTLNSAQGTISGTPTTAGTFNFTVQVTDSGPPQHTTSRPFSITIVPSLNITTAALPQGVTGFEYTATMQATGGVSPYSWSSTTLPSRLVIGSSSGQILGTPTATGSTPVTIQVTDSSTPPQVVRTTLNLIVTSPTTGSGGDFIFRGFYLPSYTGTGLAQATLNFSAAVAGDYTITLTAHTNTYNGPVVGSATTTVTLPGSVTTSVPTIFNFPTPAIRIVPGTLVAFSMTLVSGPSQPYFAVSSCGLGDPSCTTGGPFVETEDTTPPLSVFRRNGVIISLISTPTMYTAANGVSTLSGGEALAADLTTGNLFVRSRQDPAGGSVQLAQVTPSANEPIVPSNISILVTFCAFNTVCPSLPTLINSPGSGIALDPLSSGVVIADEQANRIAEISLSNLTVSTLFSVPWTMNPFSNGTGEQQYVPVSTQFGSGPTHLLLYFWDSTQSSLYSVDATAPTIFTPLLALDQNTPAGQHVKTQGNHIAYDFNTATLLVTDGSTNSILEVNPGTSPATTTTLFANLPGTPSSIALDPNGEQIYVQIGGSIYVGFRSGGSLSLFATGFPSLFDIKFDATFGNSLFAVDKANNTVYQMPLFLPTSADLTPTSVGTLTPGQSFNETRAADVTVLSNGPETVRSLTLRGLSIGGATSAQVGARIYNLSGTLLASANATITASATVTIPISATLAPGNTYRIGFYVQTNPTGTGNAAVLAVTGATLTSFPAYTDPTGRFKVVAAWDSSGDVFPTNSDIFLPQMTVAVIP